MKRTFSSKNIQTLLALLVMLLMIKLLWVAVSVLFLSSNDLDQAKEERTKALFYRAKLTPSYQPAPIKPKPKVTPKVQGSIREITLLALYNDGVVSIVTVRYKKETKVLGIGEVIGGFTFEGAGENYAIFSRDEANYKVMLIKKGKSTSSSIASKEVEKPQAKKREHPEGEVVNEGAIKIIDRSLLDHYATNMDDIYKNIGITEIKKGAKLDGFKVNFIRSGSPFANLGLQRNDTIKSINGQELKSYNAAFAVYKDIKDIDNLSVVIVRDNKEMELEYEIN
jgi:type II secretion system protein C